MKVKVANRIYQMPRIQFRQLLETVASEQVPMGIYAIEKKDYAELRCDRCESITQLKKLTREYKSQGYKVYANGR